jgi:hypothetical protein
VSDDDPEGEERVISATYYDFWKSNDSGITWELTEYVRSRFSDTINFSWEYPDTKTGCIFCLSTDYWTNFTKLHRSDDLGGTWSIVKDPILLDPYLPWFYDEVHAKEAFVSAGDDTLFLISVGDYPYPGAIFKSIDGGVLWNRDVNVNLSSLSYMDPAGIYVGAPSLKSLDYGENWEAFTGLTAYTSFYTGYGSYCVFRSTGSQNYISPDGGSTFYIAEGLIGEVTAVRHVKDYKMIAAIADDIYFSEDMGHTWVVRLNPDIGM